MTSADNRPRVPCLEPSECRALLARHGVPPHIQRHSEQVARVARRLARALRQSGQSELDPDLVEAGALLHDIAKADCIGNHRDHAREGGRLLRELGYSTLATLVERHVVLGAWEPEGAVTEAELLNYSDKRVRHEEVVSLGERFEDLLRRYAQGDPRAQASIRENRRISEAVECKIFRDLPFGPEDIVGEEAAKGKGPRE